MNHPKLGKIIFDSQNVVVPREYRWKLTGEDVKVCVSYTYLPKYNELHITEITGTMGALKMVDFSSGFEKFLVDHLTAIAKADHELHNQVNEVISGALNMKHVSMVIPEAVKHIERPTCVELAEQHAETNNL